MYCVTNESLTSDGDMESVIHLCVIVRGVVLVARCNY